MSFQVQDKEQRQEPRCEFSLGLSVVFGCWISIAKKVREPAKDHLGGRGNRFEGLYVHLPLFLV